MSWPNGSAKVVEVFHNNDTSAYSGKPRPGYRKMLDSIAAGRFDLELAWHPDRLHRQTWELDNCIDACGVRGVTTHCEQAGQLDLATASGRMNARIVGAVARHESEHLGERAVRRRQS